MSIRFRASKGIAQLTNRLLIDDTGLLTALEHFLGFKFLSSDRLITGENLWKLEMESFPVILCLVCYNSISHPVTYLGYGPDPYSNALRSIKGPCGTMLRHTIMTCSSARYVSWG